MYCPQAEWNGSDSVKRHIFAALLVIKIDFILLMSRFKACARCVCTSAGFHTYNMRALRVLAYDLSFFSDFSETRALACCS